MTNDVYSHREGDLVTVVLNRPDKANALTKEMLVALTHEVRAAHDAKVLILTGQGRVFSAGMDLEAAKTDLPVSPIWTELSDAIANHPGLTIAALNGTVAGGSMGMVLACDLRVAAKGAKAFYPVMKLGFLPQPTDPGRLIALVGPSRAKRILMAGDKITDDEALAWGLFDVVVPADEVLERAGDMAQAALAASRDHLWGIKTLMR